MTAALYAGFLAAVAAQRLLELRRSRRNALRMLEGGAAEFGRAHYPAMVALHAAFLASCLLETLLAQRPFLPPLAAGAGALFLAAQALRAWSISALGPRWCTRVIVPPGAERVARGPYRWHPHPNYLAVALEIAAIPLIHSAWITAAAFSALNAALLAARIREEERALQGAPAEPHA